MKTLRTNAEVSFRGIIAAIRPVKQIWTAQHYHLSAFENEVGEHELEKMLFGLITEHLAEYEGFVFFCHDGDVIILAKSVGKDITDTLASRMTEIVRSSTTRDTSQLVKSYFLGFDWDDFAKLCELKITLWNNRQKEKRPAKPETISTLSRQALTEAQQKLMSVGKAERASRKRPSILLVEDDAASSFMARKALDGVVTVVAASNAAEARNQYLATMPDVVFLDIGLPDTNGHDLLREFMQLDSDAYIVMLSGNCFEGDILKAMRHGAKGFVGKPFSRAKLLQYIMQSPHCIGFAASNRVI